MKKIMFLVLAILMIAAFPIVGQESVGDANRFVIPGILADVMMVRETETAVFRFFAVSPDAIVPLVGVVGMIVLTVLLIPAIMTIQSARGRSANTPDGGFANRLKYPWLAA